MHAVAVLIQDTRNAGAELARVKELGVRLALDDFGTGDSNDKR
jgi:EAL domain-containing protein (putative c-di-GMP-specific phosphodiesterase class I)